MEPLGCTTGSVSAPEAVPVLAVYVVWHPQSDSSRGLADAIFRGLLADPEFPALRGLGIPVHFRTSVAPDEVPAPVPWGSADRTAVFVLADDRLVAAAPWRAYTAALEAGAGPNRRVVPVAITDVGNLPPALNARQAICLHEWPEAQWEAQLINNIKNDLCCLLSPSAGKVKVFLSHAKRDGLAITSQVARHFREVAKLDDFFDTSDIPDGGRFSDFLLANAGSAAALLAIQTDSFGSREWCRLEVLEAKRQHVPIVVLSAVELGETRAFPYIGNVPVVRWRDESSLPAVVGALLGEVLRSRYFPRRVEAICRHRGISPDYQVFPYPPELLTALAYRVEALGAGRPVGRFLYPDPPLGTEELLLLHQLDPAIDPVTPTILLAT